MGCSNVWNEILINFALTTYAASLAEILMDPKTYHPMVCTAKVVHANLPCMYLNIWVWTDVADILFAGIPSPASITYSGFPVDKAILGQCGGPDLLTASFNY